MWNVTLSALSSFRLSFVPYTNKEPSTYGFVENPKCEVDGEELWIDSYDIH